LKFTEGETTIARTIIELNVNHTFLRIVVECRLMYILYD